MQLEISSLGDSVKCDIPIPFVIVNSKPVIALMSSILPESRNRP
jgi:hypothetical protein